MLFTIKKHVIISCVLDNLNVCYMMLLHAVLLPPSKQVKGRHIKYTIADAQNSFTVPVNQASDVHAVIADKKNNCVTNKTTLQPFIIVIGDKFHYKEFYVVLDDIKYEFKSYMEAVEYCFKLIFVLNLKYPDESVNLWTFVQAFLFNIKTSLNIPIVETFINDLNIQLTEN